MKYHLLAFALMGVSAVTALWVAMTFAYAFARFMGWVR